jgi:hypothetical protein
MAKKNSGRRKSVPQMWTGNRPPMKHSDFRIGCEFLSGSGRWRCTDVGRSTVAAIRLNHDDDPTLYNGPPYAIAECIFDDYDIEGCEPAPKRRSYDATGCSEIRIAPFRRTKRRSPEGSDTKNRVKRAS